MSMNAAPATVTTNWGIEIKCIDRPKNHSLLGSSYEMGMCKQYKTRKDGGDEERRRGGEEEKRKREREGVE